MSLESYLTGSEKALDGYASRDSKWVVTDRRVIKYSSGEGTKETFHDLSLDKISSTSIVRTNREWGWLVGALVLGVIGIVAVAIPFGDSGLSTVIAVPSLLSAAVFVYAFWDSDKSYFQFRAAGVHDEDLWKMNATSADEFEEVKEFAETVRKRSNKV
jgi:hypothetical protein